MTLHRREQTLEREADVHGWRAHCAPASPAPGPNTPACHDVFWQNTTGSLCKEAKPDMSFKGRYEEKDPRTLGSAAVPLASLGHPPLFFTQFPSPGLTHRGHTTDTRAVWFQTGSGHWRHQQDIKGKKESRVNIYSYTPLLPTDH